MTTIICRKPHDEADPRHSISHEILTLRAQLRHTLAALLGLDDYAEREAMSDIGFALIDADKRLTAIDSRIEGALLAVKAPHEAHA